MEILFKILILLAIIIAVVFDAMGDAHIDKSKRRSHFLELSTILSFLVLIVLSQVSNVDWKIIISIYILMRIGLFNLTYNIYRGLDIFYRGTTDKFYDNFMRKIPDSMYLIVIISSILVSLMLLFHD